MANDLSRRGFLRVAAAASAAALHARAQASAASVADLRFDRKDTVRMALIGCGGRGNGVLRDFLAVDGVQVTAVCDTVEAQAKRSQAAVERAGQRPPAIHAGSDTAFEKLLQREDVDFAYIATPWEWHVPQALYAMNHGKHALLEVPAATTVEDCWKLVDTSERTRRHCIMLENCCYGYNELLVLNMVRDGLFGDLLYGEAAYLHDLRRLLFEDRSEGLWRRSPHTVREGNLYPTHGLGPVANYMGINRGDRLDYLVSMSSPARGLGAWREAHVPKDSPKWKEKYVNGDLNSSLIKTTSGLMITLQHNVVNPHPYDRLNVIAGHKGIFRDYPPRIYFDGGKPEEYTTIEKYKAKYEHPLWRQQGELARKLGGHGGMDFLMVYRTVQAMRQGEVPDMDVYDAAAWSATGPLSDDSVRAGSAPVKIPDFTRGRWKERRKGVLSVNT